MDFKLNLLAKEGEVLYYGMAGSVSVELRMGLGNTREVLPYPLLSAGGRSP